MGIYSRQVVNRKVTKEEVYGYLQYKSEFVGERILLDEEIHLIWGKDDIYYYTVAILNNSMWEVTDIRCNWLQRIYYSFKIMRMVKKYKMQNTPKVNEYTIGGIQDLRKLLEEVKDDKENKKSH